MKNVLLLFALCTAFGVSSQHDPLTSLFWKNYQNINPATDGIEELHDFSANFRKTFNGGFYARQSSHGHYSTLLGNRHGIGVNYFFNQIQDFKTTNVQLNYNYRIISNRIRKLSIGISPGIIHHKVDGTWIDAQGNTVSPDNIDQSFNMNTGIAYSDPHFFAGIGITHIADHQFTESGLFADFGLPTYYYGHLRYILMFTRTSRINFEGIARSNGSFSNFDLNVRYNYKTFWAGIGTRWSDKLIFSTGWDIKGKYRLAYAYEYSNSKLLTANKHVHEFTLGFAIPHKVIFPGHFGISDLPMPEIEQKDDFDSRGN